jgi:uncharacterized membrane protein YcjF (UPF0283 family)
VVKIEKKFFVLGILVFSLTFDLWKIALFFEMFQSAEHVDFVMCMITLLLSLISYIIISRNWTSRLAYEMSAYSLQKNITLLKDGVNEKSSDVLDYLHACINNAMFWSIQSTKITMPQHQYEYQKGWMKEIAAVKSKNA